jgi:hypothetical protein
VGDHHFPDGRQTAIPVSRSLKHKMSTVPWWRSQGAKLYPINIQFRLQGNLP